jgi:hypothetical protein
MKIVIIQLTPEGVRENCLAIIGVETLKTVSFRTAKNMRYTIQGTSLLRSLVFSSCTVSILSPIIVID